MGSETTPRLSALVDGLYQARREWREQGLDARQIQAATEKLVRTYWEPLVAHEDTWPEWASAPKCAYCDGSGLVIRRVINRLKIEVSEGVPCRCPKGLRFLPPIPKDDDFTQAGKTPAKKGWSRAGR